MTAVIQKIIRRGEVWLANLGEAMGSEQGCIRPVLIVQNNKGNKFAPTVTIVPLTSKTKNNLPTHVLFENESYLSEGSIALVEQIRTIDKVRLIKYMGRANDYIMIEIDKAIEVQNKEFDYNLAYEKYMQILYLNIVMKKVGKIQELVISKNYAVNVFKKYCNQFGKNYKDVEVELKNKKCS